MNPEISKMEIVEPAAVKAWTEGRTIYIELTDSRIIGFPADRFKPFKGHHSSQPFLGVVVDPIFQIQAINPLEFSGIIGHQCHTT